MYVHIYYKIVFTNFYKDSERSRKPYPRTNSSRKIGKVGRLQCHLRKKNLPITTTAEAFQTLMKWKYQCGVRKSSKFSPAMFRVGKRICIMLQLSHRLLCNHLKI